jgi:hypothetical protein
MPWVMLYLALAVAGLVVLGVAGLRLWGDMRTLGNAVADASRRLADAASELDATSARSPQDTKRKAVR